MDFMDTRTKHGVWVVVALCAVTAFVVIVSARGARTPEKPAEPPAVERPATNPWK